MNNEPSLKNETLPSTLPIFNNPELDIIIDALENKENVLLHGPGGTGKSYNIREVALYFLKKGKNVAITATTGVAAVNLSDNITKITATTLHKFAGLQLAQEPIEELLGIVEKKPSLKKKWKEVDILIIDEISMISAEFFEKLDAVAKFCKINNNPFGGIILLLSGDFLQLPPVKQKWVFTSKIYEDLNLLVVPFLEPRRYPDEEWFHILLRIRKSTHTPADCEILKSRVEAYNNYMKELNDNLLNNDGDISSKLVVKPTVLFSTRADTDVMNHEELDALKTMKHTYDAFDEYRCLRGIPRKLDYQKDMDDAIPRTIILKIGAQVMLKTNLNVENGLCNGTRGVITKIYTLQRDGLEGVTCKWLNGKETLISRCGWSKYDKDGQITRSQIPLVLAWSLTMHKSQGCTLDYAICKIDRSVFAPGQAYVALSRVKTLSGLLLSDFVPGVIKTDVDAYDYVKSIEGE